MKKKVFRTLVCLLMAAVLTACGKVQSAADMNKGVEEGETKGDQGAYPFTLENYGREVKISQKPQKVLTLGPNCTELFVALGLRDYIVGTSLANHSRGPLAEYEEAYRDMPELNYGSATREAVITSGADFIYGLDWEFGDSALDIEELESYGMTVYMNAAVTLKEQYQEILDIGRIFGIEETAEAYVEEQKARIQAAKERAKGKEPVRVLVYDSGNNGVFTCSGINFESLLIELAGGKNLFEDLEEKQWVTVSYEEVLAREPDLILIHDYDSPSVEEKIAEIKANDTLSQLDCVKEERFAVVPLESVLAGNRMADTVERLSEAFYPETAK